MRYQPSPRFPSVGFTVSRDRSSLMMPKGVLIDRWSGALYPGRQPVPRQQRREAGAISPTYASVFIVALLYVSTPIRGNVLLRHHLVAPHKSAEEVLVDVTPVR